MFAALSYLKSIVFETYAEKLGRELNRLKLNPTASGDADALVKREIHRLMEHEPDTFKEACMHGTGSYVDALLVIAASGLAVPKMVLRENVFDDDGNLRRGYNRMDDDQDLILKGNTRDIVVFPAEIPMVSLTVCYCFQYMLYSLCCRVVLMSITGIVH